MGPNAAVWGGEGVKIHTHIDSCFTLNPWMRQPLPCVGIHLTAGALLLSSLALSQCPSGTTHTSAPTAGTLWATSSHIQTLLLSQTEAQASLKDASCFTRTVRYLHRWLSHSDCGLVPQSSKKVVGEWVSEWVREQRRGGEGRGGEKREGGGRSFQEMMLLLVSD